MFINEPFELFVHSFMIDIICTVIIITSVEIKPFSESESEPFSESESEPDSTSALVGAQDGSTGSTELIDDSTGSCAGSVAGEVDNESFSVSFTAEFGGDNENVFMESLGGVGSLITESDRLE